MTTSPWTRGTSPHAPPDGRFSTCPECGFDGVPLLPWPGRPSPLPLVTMGVVLKPQSRQRRASRFPVVGAPAPCPECAVDDMLMRGLPEMEQLVVLRHVYRLGVISHRQLIIEKIALFTGAVDGDKYLRLSDIRISVLASRVMNWRKNLTATDSADSR